MLRCCISSLSKKHIPHLLQSERLALALLSGGGQLPWGAGAEYTPLGLAVCLGEAAGHTSMDHPYSMKKVVLFFFSLEGKEE